MRWFSGAPVLRCYPQLEEIYRFIHCLCSGLVAVRTCQLAPAELALRGRRGILHLPVLVLGYDQFHHRHPGCFWQRRTDAQFFHKADERSGHPANQSDHDRLFPGWVGNGGLMVAWPEIFFPFIWVSLYFILEPINIWLGHRSLVEWTKNGNWQPVVTLWLGVLLTAFFWEMWNYLSYPKWIYHVPWGNWLHIFEMPLLGYGGYLPFALELFAMYHFLLGCSGKRKRIM